MNIKNHLVIEKKWNSLSVVKRATVVFLFCTILQKTISVVSTPIFTRLMDTKDYGQFIVYQSWVSLLAIFATFRLDYDVFNKGMSKYEDKTSYVSTMQILTSVFTIVCLIIYLLFNDKITSLIGLPSSVIIAIFVELFFMSSVSFWILKERYEFKYKKMAIITVMMSLLNIIIGVAAVCVADEKGIARIMSCVFVQVIFGIAFFVVNIRNANKIFVKEYAKFALLFNLPLILHYLSSYILNVLDKIMIQKIVSIEKAGIYGVVYSAGLVMTMISTAVNNALIPWQYKRLKEKDLRGIRKHVNEIMCALTLILTIFILFAPEFMKILASAKYYEGVYVIPPVASSILFIFLYNLVCNAEFYYDKNKFTMVASGIAAILNIILNYIFINIFGYVAAGYTTLFCYIIVAWLHVLYVNGITKKISKDFIYDVKIVFVFTLYMLILSMVATLLYKYDLLRYSLIAIAILIVFIFRHKIIGMLKG